jgi:soluble lytic murein transglycosylase
LLIRFVLFIFLVHSFFAHASVATAKLVQPFSVNVTQVDRKIAREVHQFLRDLRNKRISTAQTTQLVSLSKKSYAFQDLAPVLQIALNVSRIQERPKAFFESCGVLTSTPSSDDQLFLADRIIADIESYCRHQFWKLVSKNSIVVHSNSAALNYFRSNLHHALSGEHQSLFDQAVVKILAKKDQRQNLVSIIEDTIIDNNIVPHAFLLKSIDISENLTSFIQSNKSLDTQANRIFRDHVRESITEIRGDIDKQSFGGLKFKLTNLVDFYNKNSNYLHQNYVWRNISSLGRKLLYQKQFELSKIAFQMALDISMDFQIDEARFYLLWVDIVSKNWKSAFKTIVDNHYRETMSEHGSKLKFWISKVYENTGHKSLASNLYHEIATLDPMSFYAIMSLRELSSSSAARSLASSMYETSVSAEPMIPTLTYNDEARRVFTRLNLWLELDLERYSFFEINHLFSMFPSIEEQSILSKDLAGFFNQRSKYLHTFRVLNKSVQQQIVPVNNATLSFLFPDAYLSQIKKVDDSLDPFLIMALVRQESAFNPTARSSAGARGLMQIMPATGRSLQRNLRIQQLYNTDTNLRLGIKYFKRLLNRFDGNLVYALASYNAGQGNVRSWQKDIFTFGDDPLVQIEMIPFNETRKYVKLIYRNIYFYNLLNNKSILEAPFEETLNLSYYGNQKS